MEPRDIVQAAIDAYHAHDLHRVDRARRAGEKYGRSPEGFGCVAEGSLNGIQSDAPHDEKTHGHRGARCEV